MWIREDLHLDMSLCSLEVSCRGDLVYKIVYPCQLLRQSTLQPAAEACKEALWLARLVGDLGIHVEMPMLHCNS